MQVIFRSSGCRRKVQNDIFDVGEFLNQVNEGLDVNVV